MVDRKMQDFWQIITLKEQQFDINWARIQQKVVQKFKLKKFLTKKYNSSLRQKISK